MAAKKIEIIYDVNGKAIDVAIDKTLNLQQQAKALTAELRKTSDPEAFKLLSNRLGDVQDGLSKTSAKSKDLFTSLSLLPGPVGEFFGQLSGSIDLLKTFTSFSLKDLSFQLGESASDVADIGKNLIGLNEVQAANTAITEAETVATAELAVAETAATTATKAQTVATQGQTVATEAAEVATIGLGTALKAIGIGLLLAGLAALIAYWDDISDALTGATDKTRAYDDAQKQVTKDVTDFNVKLLEVKASLEGARKGTVSKKDALKEYNDKLGKTVGYAGSLEQAEALMTANTGAVIQSIKLRAQAQIFYAKSAEAAAKNISGEGLEPDFWDQALNYIKTGGNIAGFAVANIETYSENIGKNLKTANDFAAEGDKLINQAIENDKTLKKGLAEPPKTGGTPKEKQDTQLLEKAKKLQDDLTAVQTTGELERKQQEIQNAADAEKREIAAMDISPKYEKKRQDAILNVQKIADQKKLEAKDEFNKNEAKKDEQRQQERKGVLEKIGEFEVNAIKDQYDKERKEKQNQFDKDKAALKKALDDGLITQKEYDDAVIAAKKALGVQLAAITTQENKDEFDKKQKAYDDELKLLQIKGESLVRGTESYYDNKRQIIAVALKKDIDALTQAAADEKAKKEGDAAAILAIEQKLQDDIKALKEKATEDTKAISELQLNDYLEFGGKILSGINNIVGMASQANQLAMQNELDAVKGNKEEEDKIKEKYFEKNKKTQIAQATIGMLQAAIQAYQSLAVIPVVGPFLGGVAAAAALLFGKKQIDAIKAQQYQSSTGGGGGSAGAASAPNLGRNYEKGGLLKGPRHAQGGVMIEAEGGEAVMTRGAVTMFAPMLSMMNQMGGGTSFSSGATAGVRPDAAAVSQPAQEQAPMIMKTYVVSNELTSESEKQARLKDLSTL
jgi:hypothetical protein